MEILKFAAIDIGSNAMRLLMMNVFDNGNPIFKKASLVRVPVRLGHEVFTTGTIPEEKIKRLVLAVKSYKYLIEAHGIHELKACATSAMREAVNGQEVVGKIEAETGIKIDIISGMEEADVIYGTHIEKLLDLQNSYLYVDVGGGSTELTLFNEGEIAATKSFGIGTVRILEGMVEKDDFKKMKKWIKKKTVEHKKLYLIGSGGNVNRMLKMSSSKKKKALPSISKEQVNKIHKLINSLTFEERIRQLDMNPDRADVIVPATEIIKSVMKWSNAKRMYIPKIGLADGLVRELYQEYKEGLVEV